MTRRIYILCTLFILALVLTSCHGTLVPKNERNPNTLTDFIVPEEFDTSRNYTITFWAKNDTNKVQQNIYNTAIAEFEKLYPNIHVEIVQYNDYTKIYSDVIKNISTDTTPNVCIAYPDHVATYMEGNDVIVPLDTLINDEKYGMGGSALRYLSVRKDEVIQKFLEECIIQDKYCILPFMRSTEALYVNKTYLLENDFAIPEVFTWDYIWEVCKYAKEKAEADKATMIPLIYKSTDNMFIQLCKQNNYGYTTDRGKVLFLSDEVNQMLLDLTGPIDNGYFDTFKRVSYPGNYFNKGQCIFAIDSTAGSTWMGSKAPLLDIPESEVVDFETLVTVIPQVDTDNLQMISQGPSICLFNKKDSQEVLASWLFMQYLLTNDTQVSFAQTEGYLPVTSSAVNSEAFQIYMTDESEYDVKRAATRLIIDNIDYTFITPVFNGSSLCRSASGYLIEAMFNTSFRDKKSVERLFSTVNTRYNLSTYEIR